MCSCLYTKSLISTRTPHAGSDGQVPGYAGNLDVFQPALPMRGVTGKPWGFYHFANVFQPALPMRGVTAA